MVVALLLLLLLLGLCSCYSDGFSLSLSSTSSCYGYRHHPLQQLPPTTTRRKQGRCNNYYYEGGFVTTTTALDAKRNKQKKKKSRNQRQTNDDGGAEGQRRGSGRGLSGQQLYPNSGGGNDSLPSTGNVFVRFEERPASSSSSSSPLSILDNKNKNNHSSTIIDACVVQVVDKIWWEKQSSDGSKNPYGSRLWPSSLACAQFLYDYFLVNNNNNGGKYNTKNARLIEIGCGTGLVSIVAAQCLGANRVFATDVSPLALRLTKMGWKGTLIHNKNKRINNNNGLGGNDGTTTLRAEYFDVLSKEPLPFHHFSSSSSSSSSSDEENPSVSLSQEEEEEPGTAKRTTTPSPQTTKIVVAASVLYDASLAVGMARRVYEACTKEGAWFILGDCDTGLRDGGRQLFEDEMQRLQQQQHQPNDTIPAQNGTAATIEEPLRCAKTYLQVQQKQFGWTSKTVRILHYNPPSDVG